MLKIFVSIFIGILVGGAVTFLLTNTTDQISSTQQISLPKVTTRSIDPTTELTQLREENIQLKNEIKSKTHEVLYPKNNNSNSSASEITSNNCNTQINRLMAFFAEKDKILTEASNIKSLTQYDAKLHSDFDAEEKNESWSSPTENKFITEFSKNEKTRGMMVSAISCRSSTCEIKIPVANTESKNTIMEAISNPSFTKSIGFDNSSIKSGLQILGGEMTLYITNKN